MSLIIKVRDHYTLQVGKDTANWIRGPKRLKIRDKRVLAGQMHKIEIIQDDDSPDPVIVRGNKPAGQELADTGAARAGFGAQASVEALLKEPESDEVARENERRRREVTAKDIMEKSDATAQEAARKRVLEAAHVQKESRAKHAEAGIVEEVADDYVLSTKEHVTEDPAVTVDEITSRARPITSRVEDSILSIEDVPTPEELAAAPEIGDQAEARAAEAAKPKPKGILVEGVDPAKLKKALSLVATGALENIGEATRIYESIQKGLLILKKPTEYRDELRIYAEQQAVELTNASTVLLEKNRLLEAEVSRLYKDVKPEELQTRIGKLESDNAGLREALAGSEKRYQKTVEGRDEALQKLADMTSKAAKKKTSKKMAKKGGSNAKGRQEPDANRSDPDARPEGRAEEGGNEATP